MILKYLIRNRGSKNVAHLWNGEDTLCRLWSTGGMRQTNVYTVHEESQGFPLCQMCKTIAKGRGLLPAESA